MWRLMTIDQFAAFSDGTWAVDARTGEDGQWYWWDETANLFEVVMEGTVWV